MINDTLRGCKGNEVLVPAIADVTVARLRDECCRHIDWKKWDGRASKWVSANPTKDVAETILSRMGEGKHWQTLAGVTGTPFLRA